MTINSTKTNAALKELQWHPETGGYLNEGKVAALAAVLQAKELSGSSDEARLLRHTGSKLVAELLASVNNSLNDYSGTIGIGAEYGVNPAGVTRTLQGYKDALKTLKSELR